MNTAQLGIGFAPFNVEGLVMRLHTEKQFPLVEKQGFTDVDTLVGFYRTPETDILVYYIILNGETYRGIVAHKGIIKALEKEDFVSIIMQHELSFGGHGFKLPVEMFIKDIRGFDYKMADSMKVTSLATMDYLHKVRDMSISEELEFAQKNLIP